MNKDKIRSVFLTNGFTVKSGEKDLKQYVFRAAEELLKANAEVESNDFCKVMRMSHGTQCLVQFVVSDGLPAIIVMFSHERGEPFSIRIRLDGIILTKNLRRGLLEKFDEKEAYQYLNRVSDQYWSKSHDPSSVYKEE